MKTRREAMLAQNCECAFCGQVFQATEITCLHKRSGTVVCRSCSPVVVQLFAAIDRFGSPEVFIDHIARLVGFAKKEIQP